MLSHAVCRREASNLPLATREIQARCAIFWDLADDWSVSCMLVVSLSSRVNHSSRRGRETAQGHQAECAPADSARALTRDFIQSVLFILSYQVISPTFCSPAFREHAPWFGPDCLAGQLGSAVKREKGVGDDDVQLNHVSRTADLPRCAVFMPYRSRPPLILGSQVMTI